MKPTCQATHDPLALVLTIGVTLGLILSYLPQHLRIIGKKSSEGFSPWFLLLGSTSSSASMLNVIVLQWNVLRCCKQVGAGACFESLGGILQVSIQWALFTVILVLFLIYFPKHLKYVVVQPVADNNSGTADTQQQQQPKPLSTDERGPHVESTAEWKLAVTLSVLVGVHIALCTFISFLLLLTDSSAAVFDLWATFLGVSAAILAAFQFIPQIQKTYRTKLVGSLSIATMCIQSPGSAVMCLSIAIRPGTNWTSWATYAASGVLQFMLLVMCILWKQRQAKLGIDDFGRPLATEGEGEASANVVTNGNGAVAPAYERTPLLADPST